MKSWLFHWLFPQQRAMIMHAAKHCAEQELGREYRRKFSTLQRSPLDESVWARKFATLDTDYQALEKEMAELRVANITLRRQLQALTSL